MTADILKELRGQIDEVDDQLLALLKRRAGIAIEMGVLKKSHHMAVQDRAREKTVLDRLTRAAGGGPLAGEAVREIFENIIKACRAAQAPIRVAFVGPADSPGQAAALAYYGALGLYQPLADEAAVLTAVEGGRADIAVVILDRAAEGAVGRTLDLLAETTLKARGLITLAGNNDGSGDYFLILGREHGVATGRDRTLCCFAAARDSGSLYNCLAPLAEAGVNLCRLNSRPGSEPGEHLFFLELEGHFSDDQVARSLAALERKAERFTLLGSYEAPEK